MVVGVAAIALAACGGEEESGGTAAPASSEQAVQVHETEFALDPKTVTLESGGTYTFRAVNDGSIDHALELEGGGVEEETETIGAGESAELTVELEEGTYELYCPVGKHRDQGMVGQVVVGAGAGGAATTNGETETENETETDEDDDSGSGSGEGYG